MHSPDFIGVESCADLKPDVDAPLHAGESTYRRIRRLKAAEREYPPPIPCLARTENLPSHMPWVMKRYHTDDGRLIIREEKVRRHEYFQSYRSNGRLVINLVPLDDVVEESCKQSFSGEEQSEVDEFSGEEFDGRDEKIADPPVEKKVSEYYCFNGMRVKPCGGFAVAASAAAAPFRPPLHI